jgi:hypothetical protein
MARFIADSDGSIVRNTSLAIKRAMLTTLAAAKCSRFYRRDASVEAILTLFANIFDRTVAIS